MVINGHEQDNIVHFKPNFDFFTEMRRDLMVPRIYKKIQSFSREWDRNRAKK